jgi:16S rRNA (cytidine1402-2'-O)-methyltransferase
VVLLSEHDQSLPAGLYFVATPIGAARDITLRGLDILKSADVLAAEDTRNTRHLMDIHGIKLGDRPLLAYHDHNGVRQRPKLIALIKEGKSVAYVSDAGTPLIADPGYGLSRDVIEEGLPVFAAPGASAVLTALAVAGLPTDRFFFAGFLPNKSTARRKMLTEFAPVPGSLVFYESAKRVHKSLVDMALILGNRQAAVCRELTKKFEDVQRGTLADLADFYADKAVKGEIVVVVGPPLDVVVGAEQLDLALQAALSGAASLRDAVDQVASDLAQPRKAVYRRALELQRDGGA